MTDRPQLGFIGVGRVGGALALMLHQAGYRIPALCSRTFESALLLANRVDALAVDTPSAVAARAELVFITTGDAAIEVVCRQVAASGRWRDGQLVVHCSGALS